MPLFGSKGKKDGPAAKESISKLRETLDVLEKREQFLQKKIDDEIAKARKFLENKNKKGALMCMKRKKTYETQIEKLGGARMAVDQQVMVLEGANVSMEAVRALKLGAASLKSIHKDMNIEKIDDVMEDVNEQMALAKEVQDAISTPLSGDYFDEDELLGELDQLEQENLDEQLLQKIQVPSNSVTSKEVKQQQPDEEAELAALEASMA